MPTKVGGAGSSAVVGKRTRNDEEDGDGENDKWTGTEKMTDVSNEKSVTDEWAGRLRKRTKIWRKSSGREKDAANLEKPVMGLSEKKMGVGRPRKEERR